MSPSVKNEQKCQINLFKVFRWGSDNIHNFDEKFIRDTKKFFDENLFYVIEGKKLELNIVIDAQAIIADAIADVKNHRSYLIELMKSPFLNVYGPPWLLSELNKKIPEISKKKHLNEEELKKSINKLLKKVNIVEVKEGITEDNDIIREIKDENDIPYVKLYLTLGSQGILTADKHITNLPVTTWKRPGKLGKVIEKFENGALSFEIIAEGLPLVLNLLFELCVFIIQIMLDFIKNIVHYLSKIPIWLTVAISTTFILLLLLWEDFRKFIIESLKELYKGLKNIIDILQPLLDTSKETILHLFTEVEETIRLYEQQISG